MCLYLRQYNEAIADYNKALELNPRYVDAYINRGAAYGMLGQHDKAIADFNKVLEINPNDENAKRALKYLGIPGY